MNVFKKVAKKAGSILLNFAYNEDRAVASLGGAPKDWTISAESAKQPVLKPLGDVLDAVHFAGDPHHAQDAEVHDEVLQAVDNKISAEEKAERQ